MLLGSVSGLQFAVASAALESWSSSSANAESPTAVPTVHVYCHWLPVAPCTDTSARECCRDPATAGACARPLKTHTPHVFAVVRPLPPLPVVYTEALSISASNVGNRKLVGTHEPAGTAQATHVQLPLPTSSSHRHPACRNAPARLYTCAVCPHRGRGGAARQQVRGPTVGAWRRGQMTRPRPTPPRRPPLRRPPPLRAATRPGRQRWRTARRP